MYINTYLIFSRKFIETIPKGNSLTELNFRCIHNSFDNQIMVKFLYGNHALM